MQRFVPRDASVLKIQRELCHPKCARKVSGLSRNGPQASVVKGLVSAIQQINHFPLGNSIAFDRNYPPFEELRSG